MTEYIQNQGVEKPFLPTLPPSPRFTLRQCPKGNWYLIPYIYEYGWERWFAMCGPNGSIPGYARRVDPMRLTFENPVEVPVL